MTKPARSSSWPDGPGTDRWSSSVAAFERWHPWRSATSPALMPRSARFGELADELRQPLYSWYVPLWRGLRALMLAAFDDAAAATTAARDIGRRAQSVNAFALTFTQWWVAERLQGRSARRRPRCEPCSGSNPAEQPIVFGDAEHRLRAVDRRPTR